MKKKPFVTNSMPVDENAELAKAYSVSRSTTFDTLRSIARTLWRNKRSRVGICVMLFFVLISIFGPMLVNPVKLKEFDVLNKFAPPSREHWLGTDGNGRDTLLQWLAGTRNVLVVAFIAAAMTIFIAMVVGMVSGLCGGIVDDVLMFITNIILTVPSLPIMMLLSMVIQASSPLMFGFLLSIWSWAGLARSIRSQILTVKHRDYVEAARILGMPMRYIILSEMLPSITSYLTMNLIFSMRSAINASVVLMYLGLVTFSAQHWGSMLQIALGSSGALFGSSAIWYFMTPVVSIALFGMGCFFFSSGLDEALNPRLRQQ